MSDGSLSQDEIDALLQGTDNIEMETAESAPSPLSEEEKGVFQNVMEEASESQASNLSILMGKTVTLGKPEVVLGQAESVGNELPDEVVEVKIDFNDGIIGDHSFIFPVEIANSIAGLMMGQEGGELDEAALSAVSEAVSKMTGSETTTIGNRIGKTIKTTPPDLKKVAKAEVRYPQGDNFVRVAYPVNIEGQSAATIYELFSLAIVKEIASLAGVGKTASEKQAGAGMEGLFSQGDQPGQQPNAFGMQSPPTSGPGMQQTFGQAVGGMGGMQQAAPPPNVQPVQFANLQPSAASSVEQGNIGLLMDVYMEVTVELGRTKKLIKEILGIGEGTIIELDKLAGEPVDILVNHKLIAKGEVVVIDENFGVRVTEIVSPLERMSDLT